MLPFREITLEDKPMVEHCGSHYNYHLRWTADTTAILRLSVRATSALRWMRSSRMPLNAVFRSSSSRSLSR